MKRYTHLNSMKENQAGFTIVELLIATTVFSMVLMVILYGVLSFSHAYYAGVNSSTTQDTTRTVLDDVSQAIEFSGDNIVATTNPSSNNYYFCAGGATYYYVLGALYHGGAPSSGDVGLYVQPGSCTPTPNFSAPNGKELLAPNLRVTYFSVEPTSNPRLYAVSLSLAYGESDLLCRDSITGNNTGGCGPGAAPNLQGQSVIGTNVDDVSCRHSEGYQYCAHAALTTTVSLRVANGSLGP